MLVLKKQLVFVAKNIWGVQAPLYDLPILMAQRTQWECQVAKLVLEKKAVPRIITALTLCNITFCSIEAQQKTSPKTFSISTSIFPVILVAAEYYRLP